MAPPRKNTGILGVGNMLMSDEGFGGHCIRYIEEHCSLPDHIELLDGGTAGIFLAPFIEQCSRLYVVDVVDLEDSPGSVHRFTANDLRAGSIQTRMSPHQIGMLEILDLCAFEGNGPEEVHFFAVVPENISVGMELSPRIARRVKEVAELLLNDLSGLDEHSMGKN